MVFKVKLVRRGIKKIITVVLTMLLVGVCFVRLYHSRTDIHSPLQIDIRSRVGWVGCHEPEMKLKMDLVISPHFDYNASDEALRQREKEYMTALQRNLNHDFVRRIHVLTTNAKEVTQRLEKYKLSNQSKLLNIELKRIELTRDVFEYISQNLVGTDVMFLNGDVYLGNGFQCVDPAVMRENKIMYALTRRIRKEETCEIKDFCTEMDYIGSHDAFLFHLTEPFPHSTLEHLEFLHPSLGMDNMIIWMFETKLKYCVLNPCTILEVFHLHCSALRNYHPIKRVVDYDTGKSPFTNELVCKSSQQA